MCYWKGTDIKTNGCVYIEGILSGVIPQVVLHVLALQFLEFHSEFLCTVQIVTNKYI
jgi:hypothetical protein